MIPLIEKAYDAIGESQMAVGQPFVESAEIFVGQRTRRLLVALIDGTLQLGLEDRVDEAVLGQHRGLNDAHAQLLKFFALLFALFFVGHVLGNSV